MERGENRRNGQTWRMPANLIADIWHDRYRRFYTLIAAIGENRNRRTRHTWRSSPIAVYNRYVCHRLNNGDHVLARLKTKKWTRITISRYSRIIVKRPVSWHDQKKTVCGFVKYYYYACTLWSDYMFPVNMARSLRRGNPVDYKALNTLSTVDFEAHFKARKIEKWI